ncbi:MAG: hypothetical protein D084_Lepto4C00112G0003, partial [Leptospirillum sp. Group IV 'UBA BS']
MVLKNIPSLLAVLLSGLLLSGCASGSRSAGLLPARSAPLVVYVQTFANLTTTPDAGRSVTTLLRAELLRHPEFRLVSSEALPFPLPQGVSATNMGAAVRDRLRGAGIEAILSGSVIEYAYRSELESEPVVGMNWTMTDLATGRVLW